MEVDNMKKNSLFVILIFALLIIHIPSQTEGETDASRFIVIEQLTDHHYIPGTVNQTQKDPPTGGEILYASSAIEDLAFSSDGKWLASASRDASIKIWNTTTWKCIQTIRHEFGNMMYSLSFSPDGKWLASTAYMDPDIRIWNTTDWSLVTKLSGHWYKSYVKDVEFSPDGSILASGGRDNVIKIWNTSNWTLNATLQGHNHWVEEITFSPNNAYLASCGYDQTIRIWNTTNWSTIKILSGHYWNVESLSFSGNSEYLASGAWDTQVKIWRTSDWSQKAAFSRSDFTFVSIFPNNKWLVIGSVDGTLSICDTEDWSLKKFLDVNNKSIECLAVSPDSKWLAVGTDVITIYGNGPDLSVSTNDIEVSPFPVIAGNNVTINANIHNYGLVDAVDVPVNIYDGRELIGQEIIDITAGNSEMIMLESSLNRGGSHTIKVMIDEEFEIFEENEVNNFAYKEITINGYELFLTTEDISFSNESIIINSEIIISAIIHNTGEMDVTDVRVSIYNDTTLIGWDYITLKKGRTVIVDVLWETPEMTGPAYLFIRVDENNTLPEENKKNNIVVFKVWVGDEENYHPLKLEEDSDDDGVLDNDDAFPNNKYFYSYWQIFVPLIITSIGGIIIYFTLSAQKIDNVGKEKNA